MKIGVLGTGMVGQVIAAKLASLGHLVTIGTRDVIVNVLSGHGAIEGLRSAGAAHPRHQGDG